jgi:fibronectin type 3 domain-containing protein
VTVKSATITGAGFTASGQTFPLTLNPGQSVSLDLQFDPTTSGNATGQLTIVTNSSSNSTAVVSLTGSSSAHKVALNWDAPTGNDPIAGYNVYRAVAAASSYQRLNSRPNTDTTFTDSSVQSGQSYDYMVRSVDLSGVESKPSNKTTVTIP